MSSPPVLQRYGTAMASSGVERGTTAAVRTGEQVRERADEFLGGKSWG